MGFRIINGEKLDGIPFYEVEGSKCITYLVKSSLIGMEVTKYLLGLDDTDKTYMVISNGTDSVYVFIVTQKENLRDDIDVNLKELLAMGYDTAECTEKEQYKNVSIYIENFLKRAKLPEDGSFIFKEDFIKNNFPESYFDKDNLFVTLDGFKLKNGEPIRLIDASYSFETAYDGILDLSCSGFNVINHSNNYSYTADQKDLKEELMKMPGITVQHEGRSGFAYRNRIVVRPENKSEKTTCKSFKYVTDLMVDYKSVVYCGDVDIEYYSDEDLDILRKSVEQAKQNVEEKKAELFNSLFTHPFEVVRIGGTEPSYKIDNDRYVKAFYIRVANTKDHRQGMSHTYDYGFIDRERIVGDTLIIDNIPDKYKGIFIGKGGENIKSLQKLLNVKIILKDNNYDKKTVASDKNDSGIVGF